MNDNRQSPPWTGTPAVMAYACPDMLPQQPWQPYPGQPWPWQPAEPATNVQITYPCPPWGEMEKKLDRVEELLNRVLQRLDPRPEVEKVTEKVDQIRRKVLEVLEQASKGALDV